MKSLMHIFICMVKLQVSGLARKKAEFLLVKVLRIEGTQLLMLWEFVKALLHLRTWAFLSLKGSLKEYIFSLLLIKLKLNFKVGVVGISLWLVGFSL